MTRFSRRSEFSNVSGLAAVLSLSMLMGACLATADEPRPADDPARQARVDEVLNQWEQATSGSASLEVRFNRVDYDVAFGQSSRYAGRFVLKKGTGVRLDVVRDVPGATKPATETLIRTGGKLYQFLEEWKTVYVFPERIVNQKDSKSSWLTRVLAEAFSSFGGESPPMLFIADARQLNQDYRISLLKENATLSLLELRPRSETAVSRGKTYVWVSRQTHLPTKITALDSFNGKDTKTLTIKKIILDSRIDVSEFDASALVRDRVADKWEVFEIPASFLKPVDEEKAVKLEP